MGDRLDVVLLLALPASGKSEVRRYLAQLSAEEQREAFHLNPTVQLDDFPYVHAMRRVDEELLRLGRERVFFKGADRPFKDPRDWGTLIHLVNEDYRALRSRKAPGKEKGSALIARVEAAASKAAIPVRLGGLSADQRAALGRALDSEAEELCRDLGRTCSAGMEGRTLVIEFARGGPQGSSMPLTPPFGYRHSLSLLDEELLRRACILYVWVEPEESRRKNRARTDPSDPGSILHHGVPEEVMLSDYGCDDMDWLLSRSGMPDSVRVETSSGSFLLPAARFDNREDKTSFLRAEPAQWRPQDVAAVRSGLKSAFDSLAESGVRQ
ncbi:MAG: hypothetical protein WCU88_06640 [Elusimicrobiota bacterium]|jgi:hypothetical protein